jgi:hypothetical protein
MSSGPILLVGAALYLLALKMKDIKKRRVKSVVSKEKIAEVPFATEYTDPNHQDWDTYNTPVMHPEFMNAKYMFESGNTIDTTTPEKF